MSKRHHKSPYRINSHKHKSHSTKDKKSVNNTGQNIYEAVSVAYDIPELERLAEIESKVNELNDCVEFVSQLVDLFKHTIIIPELQNIDGWHDDIAHAIKRNKGTTGNIHLDIKVEEIVLSKGLTKEQWQRLLTLNFAAGDTLEMIHTARNHLKKVHDMTTRLFEGEEQAAVIALIDSIEKHMPENYFTDH